ncbi:MAG: oligosaccharide flippase family protein [Acidobacteriia bacterium]|nr:oligosaccharide flippase family protein [Terriglobia bacterium]
MLVKGTVVLTTGRVAGYVLSFLRNMILARMLAKADYGLAVVFGMAMTLVELSGNMLFGLQLVQSKEGENPLFQASAQALQFSGGICSGVLLAVISVPMARLFKVPQAWWAFALLAVVPICQGLSHLDPARRQRNLDYLPVVLVDVVPQFLITAAAFPLASWLGDYRVIIWLMICKAALGSAMSFVLARRPYRWAWESAYVRSMLSFGWPLLLTGFVMFGCQQADQVLVGAVFSLNVLANYALAYFLVSIPWFIFGQVGGSLMLPLLSRAQDDPDWFRRQYRVCAQASTVAGVVIILPLIVAGEQLVTLLFGVKYRGTGMFVAVLGAAFALRFLRVASATSAMAKADTVNQLYSYIWRAASLPLALGVVLAHGTPLQIAACAVLGEVLAAIVSLVRLWRRQRVPLRESFAPSAYLLTLVTLGVGFSFLGGANLSIWPAIIIAVVMFSIAVCTAWFMFPEVGRSFLAAIRRNTLLRTVQPARS